MARPFHVIFTGTEDHYGTYDLPQGRKPVPGEKFLGRAKTVKAPVTVDLYTQHLQGEGCGLGIVPIRADGTVMWFAIDVDDYEKKGPDHWSKLVDKFSLPLVVTRSKSNGTHLWCFLTQPISAYEAQQMAKKFLRKLKLSNKTEVFPKQTEVNLSAGIHGSWINLPYFGDTRTCVVQGRDLTLADFLNLVAAREITPEDLEGSVEQTDQSTKKMPPCIEIFEKIGVMEGGRSNTLFHVGVYLKRRYPDDWGEHLLEWNKEHCEPPMAFKDIQQTLASVDRKNYQYKCNEAPMSENCDKKTCLRREYGIGNAGDEAYTDLPIVGLTRLLTEPVTWIVEINGAKIKLTSQQLASFPQFQMRVMEEIVEMLPSRSPKQWQQEIAALTKHCVDEQVPAPVTERGQIENIFVDWTAANIPVMDKKDYVARGLPYYDPTEDTILFKGMSFVTYLSNQLPNRVDAALAWDTIKSMGGVQIKSTIYGKQIELWSVPCKGEKWFETPDLAKERF